MAKIVGMGITCGNMDNKNLIDFNTKELSNKVYELVLAKKLEKGEYVFTNGMNSFTFSIE